ncbi:UBC-like protein [Gymnopus androsaceus JB14]|uniref:UBC-like protein n=1 Tax=Gymnopus androsaceus JB14 TaxID=1447944 RepID=A0A6A4HWZ0_9AGAR|nr:UBC-like protein [Gymnopus androsaceus JB14]
MPPPAAASPMTLKRIHREIADLKKEDLGAMTLAPSEDNMFLWKGQIPGPEGSVYEGGLFNLDVTLATDYPFTAPRVTFKTRIYHMNISERGDICIDILKNNWSPALSLFKVLLSLSSLLTDPNPRDPLGKNTTLSPSLSLTLFLHLVGVIANQYTTDRNLHDSTCPTVDRPLCTAETTTSCSI